MGCKEKFNKLNKTKQKVGLITPGFLQLPSTWGG